jgi:di/tricarboxylate transporter
MTPSAFLVFGILAFTIVLFMSERLRLDVVALMALLALTLTGILTAEEALAGFADPIVLMIAGLFVVGDGLFQTGVARAMGRLPARLAGDSEVRLLIIIMVLVALLSGFMSSTGTVAVMLPVVMGLAWARDLSPSRLLIPLSVASLLGGMLTLIGTAPNVVVSQHLESLGREGFGMFAFTPVGVVMVVAGIAFMALLGRNLLPDRPGSARPTRTGDPTLEEMAEDWALGKTLFRLRVLEGSSLIGPPLVELNLPAQFGVTVTEVEPAAVAEMPSEAGPLSPLAPILELGRRRQDRPVRAVDATPDTCLMAGDAIVVQGDADGVHRMIARFRLALEDNDGARERSTGGDMDQGGLGMAEVLLTPRSSLLGKTLKEIRFRDRYQLSVIGIKRLGTLAEGDFRDQPLRFGDTLLVKGGWDPIRRLQGETRDVVVAMAPREMDDAFAPLGRAPLAVAIMIGMMLLLTLGVVPAVTAVLLAAVAMVLTGCVKPQDAYRAINWESVVLIAAILPMATALEKTGGMAWMVGLLTRGLDGAGPLLLLVTLFVLTSTLSQVISNTATAVLLAPIASSLAFGMGVRPEPFLMTLAVAASAAFATPVASPVNTLVLGPGGYKFGDFLRVGLALQGIILVLTALVVPWLFPF